MAAARPIRTEHDLPPSVVFGGSAVLIVLMFLFLQFKPVPGAYVGPLANLAAALLIGSAIAYQRYRPERSVRDTMFLPGLAVATLGVIS